jgi:hypothetical protein
MDDLHAVFMRAPPVEYVGAEYAALPELDHVFMKSPQSVPQYVPRPSPYDNAFTILPPAASPRTRPSVASVLSSFWSAAGNPGRGGTSMTADVAQIAMALFGNPMAGMLHAAMGLASTEGGIEALVVVSVMYVMYKCGPAIGTVAKGYADDWVRRLQQLRPAPAPAEQPRQQVGGGMQLEGAPAPEGVVEQLEGVPEQPDGAPAPEVVQEQPEGAPAPAVVEEQPDVVPAPVVVQEQPEGVQEQLEGVGVPAPEGVAMDPEDDAAPDQDQDQDPTGGEPASASRKRKAAKPREERMKTRSATKRR